MEESVVISQYKSDEGSREAIVKRRYDGKFIVVYHDNWEGISMVKIYSHLQLAEDQAEDWVL